jgi:putative DNA primase/helicase
LCREVIGYSLTGNVCEKAMFVLHGGGDNGKITLLEAIRYVMGDYAGVVDISSLMQSNQNSDTQRTVADLLGKRFVTSSETEEGHKLNESRVKSMTCMGRLVGRRIYGSAFEFDPLFKLFIDANHKPVIRGTDNAIWNRLRLIPFNASIPKAQQHKRLIEKLRNEGPGILAWAVRGCLDWQRACDLGSPKVVTDAVDTYREEMDIVAEFLAECCSIDPEAMVSFTELYSEFSRWCGDRRETPISSTAFGKRLAEKGYAPHRTSAERKRKGIRLMVEPAEYCSQQKKTPILPLAA